MHFDKKYSCISVKDIFLQEISEDFIELDFVVFHSIMFKMFSRLEKHQYACCITSYRSDISR